MSWAELECAIVDRLTQTLDGQVKRILTMAEYSGVSELSQLTPFVGLVYQGYAPVSTPGGIYGAKVQQIEHSFYVVAVIRSALDTKTSRGAREAASPIVGDIMQSLIGWRPPTLPDYGPMQLAQAPGPEFPDPGLAFYPIAFTNRRTLRGID